MLREAVSPARDEFEVRLKQQSMLADFGRRALAIDDLDVLLRETAVLIAQGLGTDMSKVMELQPEIEQPDFWKFEFGCLSHCGRAC